MFIHFLLAMLPIIWLIIALSGLKMAGHVACPIALIITVIEALFLWKQKIIDVLTGGLEGFAGCGVCVKACRQNAITLKDGKITVDKNKCNFCGRCFKACPTDAWDTVHGYIVSFGGLFGNSINKGETIIPFIEDKEKLIRICDAAIKFFAYTYNH